MMYQTLHVYPQAQQHDNAYVVGTREALLSLRNAIDLALTGDSVTVDFFANDGEGYSVIIRAVGSTEAETLAVPYTEDSARENSKTAKWPWDLL